MRAGSKRRGIGAAWLVAGMLAGAPLVAQEGVARLDGWIADSASYRLDGSFLRIRWSGETDEKDLAAYSRLARQKGDQALRTELAGKELGRLSIDNEIGRPIAIVTEERREGMTRLLVVVPRDISALELFRKSDANRYPYLVFDATLDADGVGEGELHPAARLAVSPDGKISYETLAPFPLRILKIQAS
jgi:hypothetical protein